MACAGSDAEGGGGWGGLCEVPEPVRGPPVMCDPVNIRWCVNTLPAAAAGPISMKMRIESID